MTRVVLASASPGRRKVLRQAGIDPLVVVSGVDEDAVIAAQDPDAPPGDVTNALAARQGRSGRRRLPRCRVAADCVVIGCDSMLYIDGELRGKPGIAPRRTAAVADHGRAVGRAAHRALRDPVADGAISHREVECSRHHSQISANPRTTDLTAYLASGESLRVAGGFTIDGLGGWFVDGDRRRPVAT